MMPFNPYQFIQMIKGGQNPQQLVMQLLENQMSNTPMGQNLLSLAKQNKSNEIEAMEECFIMTVKMIMEMNGLQEVLREK